MRFCIKYISDMHIEIIPDSYLQHLVVYLNMFQNLFHTTKKLLMTFCRKVNILYVSKSRAYKPTYCKIKLKVVTGQLYQ